MINVLIVDDEELVRTGLRMILDAEEDISVIGDAGDGHEALTQARRLRPDVVLMDIRMPRMDGLEAIRHLCAEHSEIRVIVLTTFDLDEHVYAALSAGANGFLLKDAPASQLLHAIRVVNAGQALLAPSVTRRLISRFADARPTAKPHLPARDRSADADGAGTLQLRDRHSSSSETPQSRPTSPAYWPNSASATESKQSSSPTDPAWSPNSRTPPTAPRGPRCLPASSGGHTAGLSTATGVRRSVSVNGEHVHLRREAGQRA